MKYNGFKLEDTYEINTWFLNIMTEMLKVLKENNKGYPSRFHKEYYEMHKDELEGVDEFTFTSTDSSSLSYYLKNKQEEMKELKRIWIPKGIKYIPKDCFRGCNIEEIYYEGNELEYKRRSYE